MNSTPFVTYPLQWTEGTLMTPQHFQQNDFLYRDILSYQLSKVATYGWGVTSVVYDKASLLKGLFVLREVEVLFPNRMIAFFPENSSDALSLNLSQVLTKEGDKTRIYLIAPRFQPQVIGGMSEDNRYEIVDINVRDVNDENSETLITRLKPKLSLSTSEPSNSQNTWIPLAEIERHGDKFVLTSYVPPCLWFGTKHPLRGACGDIIALVRDKILYLQNKIQTNTVSGLLSQNQLMSLQISRQHLITGLLPFETLFATEGISPFDIYKGLATLAAHCAALSAFDYPPIFFGYQHEDVYPGFNQLMNLIRDTLVKIEESYAVRTFQQKNRVYSLDLDAGWRFTVLNLELVAQPGVGEDSLIDWAKAAIIATDSFISNVQDSRVLGAKRTVVDSVPELKLSPQRGSILLQVSVDPDYIKMGETLRLVNISDTKATRPREIRLYLPTETEETDS
jgi:type VI secretion system protein ImpJ